MGNLTILTPQEIFQRKKSIELIQAGDVANPVASSINYTVFPALGSVGALVGNSISANNGGNTGTYNNNGAATWAKILSMQAFQIPNGYNLGVTGYTLAQIATEIATLLALSPLPDFIWLECGTNNLPLNTAFSGAGGMRDTFLNGIVNLCNGYGVPLIVETIMPRGGLTTNQNLTRCRFNNMVREIGYSTPSVATASGIARGRNFIVMDTVGTMTDYTLAGTNGNANAAYFQEASPNSLHPNTPGSYYRGKLFANTFKNFLTTSKNTQLADYYDTYDATYNPTGNLFITGGVNGGLMQGTGGAKTVNSGITPTGNVVNGMQIYAQGVTSAGTTLVGATQTRSDGYNNAGQQVMTATSTAAGGADEIYRCGPSGTPAATTGDYVYAECEYTLAVNPSNVTAISLYLLEAGGGVVTDGSLTNSAYGVIPEGHTGVLRTPLRLCTTGSPIFQSNIELHCNSTLAAVNAKTGYGALTISNYQIKKLIATN